MRAILIAVAAGLALTGWHHHQPDHPRHAARDLPRSDRGPCHLGVYANSGRRLARDRRCRAARPAGAAARLVEPEGQNSAAVTVAAAQACATISAALAEVEET
jgi:hypothetical protein